MRVLLLFSHPVESSFSACLHRTALTALQSAGHEVDDCDLYGEGFDPVLTREERIAYHDETVNRGPVAGYVDRVLAAEALVIVTPIWNFGFPAILKGFLDRVLLPGVSFSLIDGLWRPELRNVRRVSAIVTYGGPRYRLALIGDPPRRTVKRGFRAIVPMSTRIDYLALYGMDRATDDDRAAFTRRVARHLSAF